MVIEAYAHAELSESLTEIAGLLLSEEKLEAVLELCVSLTSRTLPHADGVSVTLLREGRFTTAVYSDERTRRVDAWQYATNEGPCLSAAVDGQRYLAEDLEGEPRWTRFAEMAQLEGINSVLAIPFMPNGEPIGTLNIYSTQPRSFDTDDVEIASLFANQAAIVIANSVAFSTAQLANGQLHSALESREVIGQAKGILMERERCSADEAFGLLRGISQRTNRKLRDIAQDVVDSVSRERLPSA